MIMKDVIKFDFGCFDTALAFLTAEEFKWLMCSLTSYAEEGIDQPKQFDDESKYGKKGIESYRKVQLAFYFMKEHVELTKEQQ